jgi:hypothetical protein
MLDYLETGLFRGRPEAAPSPDRRSPPASPLDAAPGSRRRPRPANGPAAALRRLLGDGRVLAVAAVVAVLLAILVGTSVPLHSTQAGPGRPAMTPSMAPRPPGTSAPPSTAPPSSTPPSARPSASPGAAGSNGAAPRPAAPAASARATVSTSPAASAPATRRAAQAAAGTAVMVTFTVTTQSPGVFEGKVRIADNGTSPLASWQVSIALPGDRVVAVANASGIDIRGILLLQPASGAAQVPARGGVLTVFFVFAGPQPVTGACTYNQSPCG